ILTLSVSCSKPADERRHSLHGQILSIAATRQEATIKHDEIKGLMPAMTMPYRVREAKLLDGLAPGDLVDASLVIVSNDAYVTDVRKVGHAEVEAPPPEPAAPTVSAVAVPLKPGEGVPDATFVDQDGKSRAFRSFAGTPLVVTFTYTSCPLPTFCPL